MTTNTNKVTYNGSYGINANWTVWNWNKNRMAIKQNRLTEEKNALGEQTQANTIQEQIVQLYIQILYETEAVRVNEKIVEASEAKANRAKEMVEVGSLAHVDWVQLEAQVDKDKYSLVTAQSQLANYKLQLKQLLEITDETPFDVAIPEISDERILAAIPPLQSVYEQALLNRPEIERSQLAVKSSDVSLSIAKAGWMPNINLQGGVTTSTNSLSSIGWGSQIKNNVNTSLGVGVSVPITDGRSTKTAVNKAKIQQLQAALDLQDQQKTLYSNIQQFWLNATTNQEKYKAAQSSVESAKQSYELLSEQFRLGLKNIVELLTGKNNLLQAEQNQLQSKYQTIYNKQMLEFYQGGEIK
jgi:outer membrane protein